jgi:hypothetical protein
VTLCFEMIDLRLQCDEASRLAVHNLPQGFHQRFETREAIGRVSECGSLGLVGQ